MQNVPVLYDLAVMVEAEDVAAAVVYLGTEDARYISGVALPVDGAQTAG